MPVKNNAMPDVITQIFPWKIATINTWKSGSIPLWNPYSFSGTVQAANYQSAVFSPFNLMFFVLPFLDAWSLLVLFQPILVGVGMYVFLRSLSRSRSGSLIGAIGFMFCNFITTWLAYATLGYAIGFLPWALWAVVMGFQRSSFVPRVVLTLSIALSLVAGHFQISIYVIGTVIAFILYQTYETKNWKACLSLMIFLLFGITLAAPQLLLTYNAYLASTRSNSFVQAEVIPWQYLITLFSPDFYGNPVTRNDWFGHYAEWGGFVGVIPLMLAGICMSSGIRGYKKFFLFLIITSVCFAYPTPFVSLLLWLKLPVLSTSAVSRIIVLLSFSIAALAAFGIDDVKDYWKTHQIKKLIIPVVIFWILIFIFWFVVIILRPFNSEQLIIAKRNLMFPTIMALVGSLCLVIGCLPNNKKKNYYKLFGMAATIGLIVLSMFDMYRFASKWMPFDPRNLVYPQVKSLTYLQKIIGVNRVFGNIGGEVGNTFSLPLIDGYDAMYQGRYGEFIHAISNGKVTSGDRSVVQFDKHGIYKTQALQLLGVRYIYHRFSDGRNSWVFPYWEYLSDSSMKQIYDDEQYEIFEYTKAYPRAFLTSSYQVSTTDQKIIDLMFAPTTNLRETVILEEIPGGEPGLGDGKADIVRYTSDQVLIKTESKASKLLFLSDAYDSGWRVTVDGRPSKVLRADYDFRAVFVPSGVHMVQFTYFPDSLRVGIIISILTVIAILGTGILGKMYENRHL